MPAAGGAGPDHRAPAAGIPSRTGDSAPASAPKSARKRVLFVCIGNSIRSQLAEAFARAYGADVIDAHSAGVSPAVEVSPFTKKILAEHNLSSDNLFPKGLEIAGKDHFHLLINMSGRPISLPGARVLHWQVEDPIGKSEDVFRAVAGQVERLVQRLVLELRQGG